MERQINRFVFDVLGFFLRSTIADTFAVFQRTVHAKRPANGKQGSGIVETAEVRQFLKDVVDHEVFVEWVAKRASMPAETLQNYLHSSRRLFNCVVHLNKVEWEVLNRLVECSCMAIAAFADDVDSANAKIVETEWAVLFVERRGRFVYPEVPSQQVFNVRRHELPTMVAAGFPRAAFENVERVPHTETRVPHMTASAAVTIPSASIDRAPSAPASSQSLSVLIQCACSDFPTIGLVGYKCVDCGEAEFVESEGIETNVRPGVIFHGWAACNGVCLACSPGTEATASANKLLPYIFCSTCKSHAIQRLMTDDFL